MPAAERKRKQRAKAMANMTEEQNKKKESEGRSQLRKHHMARMVKNEKAEFKAKEVNVLHNIVNESRVIMINQYWSCKMYLQHRILINHDNVSGRPLISAEQKFCSHQERRKQWCQDLQRRQDCISRINMKNRHTEIQLVRSSKPR